MSVLSSVSTINYLLNKVTSRDSSFSTIDVTWFINTTICFIEFQIKFFKWKHFNLYLLSLSFSPLIAFNFVVLFFHLQILLNPKTNKTYLKYLKISLCDLIVETKKINKYLNVYNKLIELFCCLYEMITKRTI